MASPWDEIALLHIQQLGANGLGADSDSRWWLRLCHGAELGDVALAFGGVHHAHDGDVVDAHRLGVVVEHPSLTDEFLPTRLRSDDFRGLILGDRPGRAQAIGEVPAVERGTTANAPAFQHVAAIVDPSGGKNFGAVQH